MSDILRFRNFLLVPILLAIFSLIITGCVSNRELAERLQYLNYKSEGELINRLGSPSNVYESDGNKYLTFSSSTFASLNTTPSYKTQVIGDTAYTTQTGGMSQVINCQWAVTVTFREGISRDVRGRTSNNCGSMQLLKLLPPLKDFSTNDNDCVTNCNKVGQIDDCVNYCK